MIRKVARVLAVAVLGFPSAGADDGVDWGLLADLYFTAEMRKEGYVPSGTREVAWFAGYTVVETPALSLLMSWWQLDAKQTPTSFDELWVPRVGERVPESWKPPVVVPDYFPIRPTYLDHPPVDGTQRNQEQMGDWSPGVPIGRIGDFGTPGG